MFPAPTWQQWLTGTLVLTGLLLSFAILLPWWRNKRRDFNYHSETLRSVLKRALQSNQQEFLKELQFLQIYTPPNTFNISPLFETWAWQRVVDFELIAQVLGRLAEDTNMPQTLASFIREQFESVTDPESAVPQEFIDQVRTRSPRLANFILEHEEISA